MKGWALSIILVLSWTTATASFSQEHYDKMNANNQAMKDCLLAYGYDGDVLHKGKYFDWGGATRCYQQYKQGVMADEYVKLKFFLKDNPWYTGNNWMWEHEARAGYECIEYYHTGVKICRKPYYIN